MEKTLQNISDEFYKYTLDKVDCFERQIANTLEYYQRGYGHIYLIIKKVIDFFEKNKKENKKKLFETILGIYLIYEKYSYEKLIDQIKLCVDNGRPVLLVGNLKKVFYSIYYKEKDWPHLFLINGYNTQKELIYIFDNTQFSELDSKYENFRITYDMVNEFSKNDGVYNVISIKKTEYYNYYGIKAIIKQLTQLLVRSIMKDSNYILTYFCNSYDNISKAKFINLPKYLEVTFSEYLFLLQINTDINTENVNNIITEYINYWKRYVIKNLVLFTKTPDSLLSMEFNKDQYVLSIENRLVSELKKINQNIQDFVQTDCKTEKSIFFIENNNDNILDVSKNMIKFDFSKNKIYNMWINDEAPKLILYKGKVKDFDIKLSVKIMHNYSVGRFQFGVFLRVSDAVYFAAIDNANIVVIDMIGKDNLSYDTTILNNHKMVVKFEKKELSLFLDDCEQSIISRTIPLKSKNDIVFGICCKTWEKSGLLKVECMIDYLKVGDDMVDFC